MVIETLLIGLGLSLLWAEFTDLSPGGIIVPGYLALYFDRPLRLAATLVAALLALAFYRLLARRLILFGRRRFVLMIFLGAFFAQAWFLVLPRFFHAPVELQVIGWLIPGILASNLVRQKFAPTLASAVAVAALTFAVVRLIGFL
jgi:poly-gamma-glutamate biosynthesis protein PgsC/CapC